MVTLDAIGSIDHALAATDDDSLPCGLERLPELDAEQDSLVAALVARQSRYSPKDSTPPVFRPPKPDADAAKPSKEERRRARKLAKLKRKKAKARARALAKAKAKSAEPSSAAASMFEIEAEEDDDGASS